MVQKSRKHFLALAAPSGGGKTTLCQMLLRKYRSAVLSVSYTTRAPRGQEANGKDYFFVSDAEFAALIKAGELAEWAEVHGKRYGTGKKFLLDQKLRGMLVLLDIDVQGVNSIKAAFPEDTVSVFIVPPSWEILEQRLRARNTESEEKIQARLEHAVSELEEAENFDFQVMNGDLEQAFEELCEIVEGEMGVIP